MRILNFRLISGLIGTFVFSTALFAQDSFLSEEDLFNEEVVGTSSVYDPFESINRYTFEFNDFVLENVLDPIATGYQYVTPDPVETSAKNFFRNVRYPIRGVSNLLQGRFEGAWVETGRFAINTTVGLGGLFTPADSVKGFEPIPPEDFGQVLGAWGIGEGPYIVIPLLGPSNLRDVAGLVGDAALHPTREPFSLIDSWDWEWKTALGASEFIVSTPAILDTYNQMKGSAIDPYSSLKNGYAQFRRAAIEK